MLMLVLEAPFIELLGYPSLSGLLARLKQQHWWVWLPLDPKPCSWASSFSSYHLQLALVLTATSITESF
jgi:hypothetical protein